MQRTGYRADIDGLRAVAIIMVLGFHAFPKAIPGGFLGVDVFFVISGFLITGLIGASDFSFLEFYQRRARRLFPALALVTASSLVAGWLLLTPAQFEGLGRQVLAAILFAPNLLFWYEVGYFDAPASTKPLLHLWSLGVEEQFYLVWPVLLLAAARLRLRPLWIILGVAALSLLYCLYLRRAGDASAAFYSPFSRAWQLAAGGLLAVVAPNRNTPGVSTAAVACGLALIALSARYVASGYAWPDQTGFVVLGAMLVIYFGGSSELARRTLGSAPAVFLGKISYPLYLWHWPVITFLYLRSGAALTWVQIATALLASICLAAATYIAIENPLKRTVPLRRLAGAMTALLLLIGASGFVVASSEGVPSRLPAPLLEALAYENYDFKSDASTIGCWLNDAEPMAALPPACIQGSADAIAVWGDSHAALLTRGLRMVFGAERISQLTRNGCAPLLGLDAPAASPSGCLAGNAGVVELLQKRSFKFVILFGAWQNYPTNWDGQTPYANMLATTIRELKMAGASRVLVIGPAPRFDPSLPHALLRNWSLNHWDVIPARLTAVPTTKAIDSEMRAIVESAGGNFFSLRGLLCNDDGCLTKIPGSQSKLLTWDYGHFTMDGAQIVAQAIRDTNVFGSVTKAQ